MSFFFLLIPATASEQGQKKENSALMNMGLNSMAYDFWLRYQTETCLKRAQRFIYKKRNRMKKKEETFNETVANMNN